MRDAASLRRSLAAAGDMAADAARTRSAGLRPTAARACHGSAWLCAAPLLSPPPRRDRAQSQRRAADRWRGAAARAQCPNGFYGAGGIGTEPPLGRERSLQRRQGTLRLPDPARVGLEAMPSSAYDYDARRSGRAVGRCQRSGSYSQATTPRTAGTDSSGAAGVKIFRKILHRFCATSRGSRGGYPLAALGSEDWCDAIHAGWCLVRFFYGLAVGERESFLAICFCRWCNGTRAQSWHGLQMLRLSTVLHTAGSPLWRGRTANELACGERALPSLHTELPRSVETTPVRAEPPTPTEQAGRLNRQSLCNSQPALPQASC